jgi:hypothetical protein
MDFILVLLSRYAWPALVAGILLVLIAAFMFAKRTVVEARSATNLDPAFAGASAGSQSASSHARLDRPELRAPILR